MDLVERVESLPTQPGVYLFKSQRGVVLYVGKAQNLRARVRQYVAGGDGRVRMPALMQRVADVDVLLTPTVKDALLLENELIKQHKPVFNVRLRDDKQYLGLRLDVQAEWPRLTTVRRFRKDGARYFGPYTSSIALREALRDLRRLFPLRSCSDAGFRDYARRGRPCIEYEMKRCAGPCCGRIEAASYAELVDGTMLFLRGKSGDLIDALERRMREAADSQHFEEAAGLRDRIAAVERTVEHQQIVSGKLVERDVFGLAREAGEAEIQVLHVREGRVIGAESFAFSGVRIDDGELTGSFLGQYYGGDGEGHHKLPREILTSAGFDDEGALSGLLKERAGRPLAIQTPRRGERRGIVKIAESNAQLALRQRLEARDSVAATLEALQRRCSLVRLPRRIECYDVSNLQGSLAVASRVVFEDGRPVKSDYRRYRIREAAGGDDYDCLREVMGRRLAVLESQPLPDLLMVDGGRGQLAVLTAALRDASLSVDTLALAKERDDTGLQPRVKRSGGLKAERVFLPGRGNPLMLYPSSKALLLLQRVRDESHRFAIEFQRKLRLKAGLTSILEELPGIGPAKRRALLRALGSLRAVGEASEAALYEVRGISRRDAATIRRFFDATRPERNGEQRP
jgi:excinuclease ABC subunit C